MQPSPLNITERNLPHWKLDASIYFVTYRLAKGVLALDERAIVRNHLREGHGKFYRLPAAVVMPDHVHLLIQPIKPYALPRVMKGIKGVSARRINLHRKTNGQVWQDESWDRIVRDADEYDEFFLYIANNPMKSGLVRSDETYDGWLTNNWE